MVAALHVWVNQHAPIGTPTSIGLQRIGGFTPSVELRDTVGLTETRAQSPAFVETTSESPYESSLFIS